MQPDRPLSPGPSSPWPVFPAGGKTQWKPLARIAQHPTDNPSSLQPARAAIQWSPRGLDYEIVCQARAPSNRARGLNEHTWELGDICEILLQLTGRPEYYELHVTPENQRLQLRWLEGDIALLRNGTRPLADFLIPDPDWVNSTSQLDPERWTVRVHLPARAIGVEALTTSLALRTAVCRYDYAQGPEPVCSSTASFSQFNFHCPAEWHPLELRPAG